MLDIKVFREDPEGIKRDLEKREMPDMIPWVDEVVEKDKEHRKKAGSACPQSFPCPAFFRKENSMTD